MRYNSDKLRDMIHYIVDISEGGELGKTKLNKILWFSDREMFLRSGATITGETYLRYPQGPVSQHILDILHTLSETGKILIRTKRRFDYEQYTYLSLAVPDISTFTGSEIDVITRQVSWILPMTAVEISAISHGRAWELAEKYKEIPMFSVLAEKVRDPLPDDLAWALAE
jgi:hypothetical protein